MRLNKPPALPKRFLYTAGARTVYRLTDAGLARLAPLFENARKRSGAVEVERLAVPYKYEVHKWDWFEGKMRHTVTQHQATIKVEVS